MKNRFLLTLLLSSVPMYSSAYYFSDAPENRSNLERSSSQNSAERSNRFNSGPRQLPTDGRASMPNQPAQSVPAPALQQPAANPHIQLINGLQQEMKSIQSNNSADPIEKTAADEEMDALMKESRRYMLRAKNRHNYKMDRKTDAMPSTYMLITYFISNDILPEHQATLLIKYSGTENNPTVLDAYDAFLDDPTPARYRHLFTLAKAHEPGRGSAALASRSPRQKTTAETRQPEKKKKVVKTYDELLKESRRYMHRVRGKHDYTIDPSSESIAGTYQLMRYFDTEGITAPQQATLLVKFSGTEKNPVVKRAFSAYMDNPSAKNYEDLFARVKENEPGQTVKATKKQKKHVSTAKKSGF